MTGDTGLGSQHIIHGHFQQQREGEDLGIVKGKDLVLERGKG